MGNLPVIFKFSRVKAVTTALCDFMCFLLTFNAARHHDVTLSCGVTDRPRATHNRSSARIITTMPFIFKAAETNLRKITRLVF